MIETSYNPDVLTCLANLSNDEVFTPPTVVNDMLDLLPSELWSDPKTTFLDPVSKSGVFLREITKRLDKGFPKFSASPPRGHEHATDAPPITLEQDGKKGRGNFSVDGVERSNFHKGKKTHLP